MMVKKRRINLNNKNFTSKIYIFSYFCLLFFSIFYSYSEFSSLNGVPEPSIVSNGYVFGIGIFVILQLMLLIINLFMEGNRYRECLFLFNVFSIIMLFLFHSKISSVAIILLLTLIVNSNLVDFKQIIKIDFFIKFFSFALILLMFLLNLFPSEYNPDVLKHGDIVRSTLGFNHPNTLAGFYLFFLISLLLYVNSRIDVNHLSRLRKIFLFSFIAISGIYIEFIITDSRSSEIAISIIILLLFVYMVGKINVPKSFIGLIFLLVICFTAIVLSLYYNLGNNFMYQLNVLSSNRLALQHMALQEYGIKIFGNAAFVQGHPLWIDNQYVFDLVKTGIIGSLFYLWLFYELFRSAFKNNDFVLFLIAVAIVVKSMFESTSFECYAFVLFIYSFKLKQEKNKLYI